MTVIVDGVEREDVEPPAVWLHNWMYSIVPGPGFDIFLAGFCKNCKTAFTQKLYANKFSGGYAETDSSQRIPKYGCVGPS